MLVVCLFVCFFFSLGRNFTSESSMLSENALRTRLLGFTIFKSTGKLSWFSNVILSQGVSFI